MRDTCNQSVKRGREAMWQWVGGRRKSRCCKKKDLQREGCGLKPRRGSCGSSCLLRHKCDRAPPGPVKTLRIKCIREYSLFLRSSFLFFNLLYTFFVLKCEEEGQFCFRRLFEHNLPTSTVTFVDSH